MAQLPISSLKEFSQLNKTENYRKQAQFFLNAFWKELGKEAEHIWDIVQTFIKLDKSGDAGKSLDEFNSARLLEQLDQAMTAVQRRNALKEIDVDTDNMMSLLEYLVWHYKLKVDDLMSRPQGVSKELEEAEAKLNTLKERIATIQRQRAKWDGKEAPTEGIKKTAYEQDMKQLGDAEKYLEEALDFARRKLKAAEKSTNVQAQGKLWWIQREVDEAAKFAPPKKQKKEFTPNN